EVLDGNDPSAILGSSFARNLNLCSVYTPAGACAADADQFNEGWVRMELGNQGENFLFTDPTSTDPSAPNIVTGLPATGFWVANYVNANAAPGTLANYSSIHRHRADRNTV